MLSILCGVRTTNPCRRTPTSSSLLSEPSTVKLFERARMPLTENWPGVPIPEPRPGPAIPFTSGGGATPAAIVARSSKLRILPRGRREICRSSAFDRRVASSRLVNRPAESSPPKGGSGVGGVGAGGVTGDGVGGTTAGGPMTISGRVSKVLLSWILIGSRVG